MDAAAREILQNLRNAGYLAYLVGGCVRDTLLGRPIHDWDITTNAKPEEIAACFEKTVLTGARYGTVIVLLHNSAYEVTTFRTDGAYRDNRRPDQVKFVASLQADLARRDFTINAMAMDQYGRLTDPFGGREDLASGCIRAVGNPMVRFEEDALRMIRAIRFQAQLGFTIAAETRAAIGRCAPMAAAVSAERVRDELEKILCSQCPETVEALAAFGFLRRFGVRQVPQLRSVKNERLLRWASLKLAVPELDLAMLRLDRTTIHCVQAAVDACRGETLNLPALYAAAGMRTAEIAAVLCGKEELLESLARDGRLVCLQDLAVRGNDLSWLRGPAVGKMLHKLLVAVQNNPDCNHKEQLLKLAHEIDSSTN